MRLLNPLFAHMAAAVDSERARMVEYLKAENQILRDKLPKRITVTPRERSRLVRLGRRVGPALAGLVTIVTPRTFARWVTGDRRAKPGPARKPGRPRTPDDIRALVLRIARETGWGYTRVLGELKKLGIHAVSRTTGRWPTSSARPVWIPVRSGGGVVGRVHPAARGDRAGE